MATQVAEAGGGRAWSEIETERYLVGPARGQLSLVAASPDVAQRCRCALSRGSRSVALPSGFEQAHLYLGITQRWPGESRFTSPQRQGSSP